MGVGVINTSNPGKGWRTTMNNVRMQYGLILLAAVLVPACEDMNSQEDASSGASTTSGGSEESGDSREAVGVLDGDDLFEDALISAPATANPLVCKSELDCAGPCKCQQGVCILPDVAGPPPPTCEPPPRDLFEVDDTWQQWKAYGEPQVHNFHHAADNDWVAVYFGGAGTARFRTHDLASSTDTKLEVYRYTANGKGALVGTHDDIGGSPYLPESKASRLDMSVPANSAYLVRVINKTPAWFYEVSVSLPTYTLSITYL